jgi:adenylate cyclase
MKIVFSYRRADSEAMAGRIRDRLAGHYGNDAVFMDIDSIPFGTDFRRHFQEALAQSDVLIAIIGPRWLDADGSGDARINDETDPVRIEIETALQRGITIMPLLIGGSRMPDPAQLPDSLKKFAFINAAPIDTGRDFHHHIERLIRALDGIPKNVEASSWAGAAKSSGAESSAAGNPGVAIRPALSLPDKPSVAVLPFTNIGGDPEQEYFAAGIVEEIITALSRFSSLLVIARNSSFIYKDRTVDVKQVARELGVRYVLEGSVRKFANRVRITGQLIDASTGAHIWADRLDGELEDIFDLQDQISANVVGAVAPKLELAEIERAKRKPTDSLDAYDYYLRGVAGAIPYTKEGDIEALRLFYRAIELDHDFAVAHGWAAWIFHNRKNNGWMTNRAEEIAEGTRLARRAVELGGDDAAALCWGGYALAYLAHELDDGIAYLDKALILNPNLAAPWYLSGWLRVFLGEPDDAIERFVRAIRLSPLDPFICRMHAGIAYAHFFAGRHEEARSWAEKAVRPRPNWLTAVRGAAVSYAIVGRLEEARKYMEHMRKLDPTLCISNLKDLLPLRRAEDFAKWADALRAAGLPE